MARTRLRQALEPRADVLTRAPSHLALGKEFLRRMARWATALDCLDLWPFFDVAQRAMPSLEPASPPEFLGPRARCARDTLTWWLRYVPLARSPALTIHGLPDPYLPLVRMIERGASYYTEQQLLHCGSYAISYRVKPSSAPSTANELPLNDAALDAIDAAALAKGGG